MHILNNTQHIVKEKFNKTRIPRLQFDILGCLLLNGELTRGELEKKLEKNHTDITKSVSFLLSKELIEPSTRIPSKTRPGSMFTNKSKRYAIFNTTS